MMHTHKRCLLTRDSWVRPGNTNCGGRLSTDDLLIKVACLVKKL
jgi:hypothetical protein